MGRRVIALSSCADSVGARQQARPTERVVAEVFITSLILTAKKLLPVFKKKTGRSFLLSATNSSLFRGEFVAF